MMAVQEFNERFGQSIEEPNYDTIAGYVFGQLGRVAAVGDQVSIDGRVVRLSGAPLAVLAALAEQPGRVMSRRQLMAHLPSGLAATEHAVEMAVARLRTAVGSELVQTVVKRGYRLRVDDAVPLPG